MDNTAPSISGFALSNLPGFYNVNDFLNFRMTFDEAVSVTGTPRFSVDFGTGGPLNATYVGGTGTTSLSFTLLIDNTIADTNAYDAIISPLDLNGGTIKDEVNNSASLDFSGLIAAVLNYSSTVNLNGQLPYVVSVTNPAN